MTVAWRRPERAQNVREIDIGDFLRQAAPFNRIQVAQQGDREPLIWIAHEIRGNASIASRVFNRPLAAILTDCQSEA